METKANKSNTLGVMPQSEALPTNYPDPDLSIVSEPSDMKQNLVE